MSDTEKEYLDDMVGGANDYLTDEDLDALISQIEAEEEIEAPQYMLGNILELISEDTRTMHDDTSEKLVNAPVSQPKKPPRTIDIRKKRREYYAFCAKVAVSVAAAIAIMIVLPLVEGKGLQSDQKVVASYDEEMERIKAQIPSKEECIVKCNVTKEEATASEYEKIVNNINNLTQTQIGKLDNKEN